MSLEGHGKESACPEGAGYRSQEGEESGAAGPVGQSGEPAPPRVGQGDCRPGLQQQPLALLFGLC